MSRADDIRAGMKRSSEALKEYVWPTFGPLLGGGELRLLEDGDDTALMFDRSLGIDALQIMPNGTMRGIASRVQYQGRFESFSVRYKRTSGLPTEFMKRMAAAVDEDATLPAITIQAYLSPVVNGQRPHLMLAGAVRTRALYSYIRHEMERTGSIEQRFRIHYVEGASFFPVWWRDLREAGVPLVTWAK